MIWDMTRDIQYISSEISLQYISSDSKDMYMFSCFQVQELVNKMEAWSGSVFLKTCVAHFRSIFEATLATVEAWSFKGTVLRTGTNSRGF